MSSQRVTGKTDLRSSAMVEAQHSAEPLNAFDGARCRFDLVVRLDQSIIDPLMIPLTVVVSRVLASGLSERPFAEEDHPIETLVLDRPDEPLRVGVQVGRTIGQADDFDGNTSRRGDKSRYFNELRVSYQFFKRQKTID